MADGAGKLDKLARLKNLKSGFKAKTDSSGEDGEDLSLDDVLGESGSQPAKPLAAAAGSPTKADQDGESLSAYFEALGIVPDEAKLAGTTGMPAKAAPLPSADEAVKPEQEKGREVDARDRWADPVREDDAFLSSFAGNATTEASREDDEELTLDSIIGSFDEDEDGAEDASGDVRAEAESTPVLEKETVSEPVLTEEPKTEGLTPDELSVANLLAEEMALELPPSPAPEPVVDPVADLLGDEEAFGKPIDIEAFEKEIGVSATDPDTPEPAAPPASEADADKDADVPLSITFDETRATLLSHVSKQMNCSIDDVVVTAVDWYLDALFGEDDPEMGAGAAE